jgi:hypothetical protein
LDSVIVVLPVVRENWISLREAALTCIKHLHQIAASVVAMEAISRIRRTII